MALVHTKLRNRLGSDKVAKLVHVYRHFGWEEDDQEDDNRGDLMSDYWYEKWTENALWIEHNDLTNSHTFWNILQHSIYFFDLCVSFATFSSFNSYLNKL